MIQRDLGNGLYASHDEPVGSYPVRFWLNANCSGLGRHMELVATGTTEPHLCDNDSLQVTTEKETGRKLGTCTEPTCRRVWRECRSGGWYDPNEGDDPTA